MENNNTSIVYPIILNPNGKNIISGILASCSIDKYLQITSCEGYLTDCIKLNLDRRGDRPIETTKEYFELLVKGENILLREFSILNQTLINRYNFVHQVEQLFSKQNYSKFIKVIDYHQLVSLLCSDFPRQMVLESVRCLYNSQGVLSDKLPFHVDEDDNDSALKDEEAAVEQYTGTYEGIMFEEYDLSALHLSLKVYFLYYEFFNELKDIFNNYLVALGVEKPFPGTNFCFDNSSSDPNSNNIFVKYYNFNIESKVPIAHVLNNLLPMWKRNERNILSYPKLEHVLYPLLISLIESNETIGKKFCIHIKDLIEMVKNSTITINYYDYYNNFINNKFLRDYLDGILDELKRYEHLSKLTFDQIEDMSRDENKGLNRKASKKSNVNLK